MYNTSDRRIRGRRLQAINAAFLAQHPLCVHCMAQGRVTPAAQVDHIVPLHKGGADDQANRQALCIPCHEAKTAADLGVTRRQAGADHSGWPADPAHPWNRTRAPNTPGAVAVLDQPASNVSQRCTVPAGAIEGGTDTQCVPRPSDPAPPFVGTVTDVTRRPSGQAGAINGRGDAKSVSHGGNPRPIPNFHRRSNFSRDRAK